MVIVLINYSLGFPVVTW